MNAVAPSSASSVGDPVALLTGGRVRGTLRDGVRRFLDVPYAAAPTGPWRFERPLPHPGWTGVRDATSAGPTAPQPPRSRFGDLDLGPFFDPGWVEGDEYLTVNVWAPAAPARGAPVLVFVHGGAFIAGSNRAPAYDGTAFARSGVVVVDVNYRLGVPGFLQVPGAPDNRGCLDVVEALRWVRANAEVLGGDPDRVTLAGQSAGAVVVATVLASGKARDLVAGAVMQSGSGDVAFAPEQAERVTSAVAARLGVRASAQAFAKASDASLVQALADVAPLDLGTARRTHPIGGIVLVGPILGQPPSRSVAAGEGRPVARLLIGTNADEAGLYLAQEPVVESDAALLAAVARYGVAPAEAVARHRAADPSATPERLRLRIAGDAMFGEGTRHFADACAQAGVDTFSYEFTWRSDALDGRLGSCHLMELPFVFGNTRLPALHGSNALLGRTPAPPGLVASIHQSWVRFVASGDPGWEPNGPGAPAITRLDMDSTVAD